MNVGSGAAEAVGSVDVALAHAGRLLERDPALAAEQASEILKVAPGHPGATLILGIARRTGGDPTVALAVLEPLAMSQPRWAAAHYELGLTLGALGRSEEAVAALRRSVQLNPDLPDAWRVLADHLMAVGDDAGALYRQGKYSSALPQIERLLATDAGNPNYRNLYAAILAGIGEYARAIATYVEVLKVYPRQAKIWLSYGHALKTSGQRAEGIGAYRRAIELDPHLGEVWWSLANLKTYRFGAEELAHMRAQLARADLSVEDRYHFHFALGKALEDQSLYAESFEHYREGNALRRARVHYEPERIIDHVARCKAFFTGAFFASRAGAGALATDPIFIVGLPRAGSTLIEQILSSHSQVEGTMELPDVPALAQSIAT